MKSSLLELLCKQTVACAIPRDQLHIISATIEENEKAIRKRILFQHGLHHGDQARERLSHVDWLAIGQQLSPSSFQQGCFPPCLCPITVPQKMVGSFDLVVLQNEYGNKLDLRTDAPVMKIWMDGKKRTRGVRFLNRETGDLERIFLAMPRWVVATRC